jgi:hypothetical protein
VSNERTAESNSEAKLAGIVKDLQEVGRRIENIRDNLLPPERATDDENTIELRNLQRDLIGEFASVACTLFKAATRKFGTDDDPGDLSSDLNLFRHRCERALRVRGGWVRRGRARRSSGRIARR